MLLIFLQRAGARSVSHFNRDHLPCSLPVADLLQKRGVPFVFLTGYSKADIPAAYADCLFVAKPFRVGNLLATIDRALASRHKMSREKPRRR